MIGISYCWYYSIGKRYGFSFFLFQDYPRKSSEDSDDLIFFFRVFFRGRPSHRLPIVQSYDIFLPQHFGKMFHPLTQTNNLLITVNRWVGIHSRGRRWFWLFLQSWENLYNFLKTILNISLKKWLPFFFRPIFHHAPELIKFYSSSVNFVIYCIFGEKFKRIFFKVSQSWYMFLKNI